MLFVIDDSLASNLTDETTIEALGVMATACREGKHALFAKRGVLKQFSECSDLSRPTRSLYKKLASKASLFPDWIKIYAEVSSNITILSKESIRDNSKTVIKIPTSLINSSVMQETILLCENINDGEFIGQIALKFYKYKQPVNINLIHCYSKQNGGGNTTHLPYAENIRQKKLCLCILDSDKSAPGYDIGETAKRVQRVHDTPPQDYTSFLSHYHVLEVRELENLIPTPFYIDFSSNIPDHKKGVAFLQNTLANPDVQRYSDLKKGLKLYKLLENSQSALFRFWEPILQTQEISLICSQPTSCSNLASCQCSVVPGLGDKILERIQEFVAQKPERELFEKIQEAQLETDWLELGQLIFDWCCASNTNQLAG